MGVNCSQSVPVYVTQRCGSLWIVVDRCGSLWIVVDRCGSLWVVPGFSDYAILANNLVVSFLVKYREGSLLAHHCLFIK